MARTINETTITQHLEPESTPAFEEAVRAVNTLAAIDQQAADNALVVARQLGYDGTLTVGALEDEIRFYQRRTVEGVLELGKRLLILKELSPHGEFHKRVQLLGIDDSLARKFMSATLKFSKRETFPVLKMGTQSRLLELLVLDDGEIEALESGGSVRGVTLDAIETMSVSELKKALREARDTATAKDRVISDKTAELNKKAEKLALLENAKRQEDSQPVGAEQRLVDARSHLQTVAADIKANVMTRLRKAVKALSELDGDHATFASVCLIEIGRELAILRDEYQLPASVSEDLMPEWLDDDALAHIEAMGHED